MIEKKVISLSITDVRDAIMSHITRTTGRQLVGTVFINDYPLVSDYTGAGRPVVEFVYGQEEISDVLPQGQLVNVHDPKDSGRNPFSVRFGKRGSNGIITYSLYDAIMEPASRGYTRDELEVLTGEMAVGMGLIPDRDSHITDSKSDPFSKDAVLRIWETELTEGVTRALDRHYRFKLVPAEPDTSDKVSQERHDVIVNNARLGTWRTQQMHDVYVYDNRGAAVDQVIKTYAGLIENNQKAIDNFLEFDND